MDDSTTSIVVSAIVLKDLIVKLLGPTFGHFGNRLKDLAEISETNLRRILSIAVDRVNKDQSNQGPVNLRVLKATCDEGQFIDDSIAAEYFGGVLASSNSTDGNNDDLLPTISMLKSMSTNQIRLHFVIYAITAVNKRPRDRIFEQVLHIDIDELLIAMHLKGSNSLPRLLSSLIGLADLGLIDGEYAIGASEFTHQFPLEPRSQMVSLIPTWKGASLFSKAFGMRGIHPELITGINIQALVPNETLSTVCLPQSYEFKWHPTLDQFGDRPRKRKTLKESISDIEYEVESIKDDMEELKSEMEKQEND